MRRETNIFGGRDRVSCLRFNKFHDFLIRNFIRNIFTNISVEPRLVLYFLSISALDEIKPVPAFEFSFLPHTQRLGSLTMEVSPGIRGHRSFWRGLVPRFPFRKLASWSHLHDSSRGKENGSSKAAVPQENIKFKNNRGIEATDLISSLFRNSNVAARIDEDQRTRCASSEYELVSC